MTTATATATAAPLSYPFAPTQPPAVEIEGTHQRFPVHRIYCVGRNYAARALEMGVNPAREKPFFFSKPAGVLVPNGQAVRYPSHTTNFHHEVELVVAIGQGGRNIGIEEALRHVYGYAVGNDLTRRDLLIVAQDKRQPWEVSKSFDDSAPITAIHRASHVGHLGHGRIWLGVNGVIRQSADIADLIWNVPEIIAEISALFSLTAGDLIFTGTPAGVGPVEPGDRMEAGIEGLGKLITTIARA